MVEISVVFYHPKNPRNVSDLLTLIKHFEGKVVVVKREGAPMAIPGVEVREDLVDAVKRLAKTGRPFIVVLETYGVHIDDISIPRTDHLVVIVGAEDYGVPEHEVERLKSLGYEVAVARLPMAVPGTSYNVVASFAILLYELKRRGILGQR
jgi:tRNA (cytidine/uridine-2'-O-)-methyltransferase